VSDRLGFAKDLVKDLRESGLWPLAIVLAVAVVVIPVVLSKPAKNSSAPALGTPASAQPEALPGTFKPIVNLSSASPRQQRKSVVRLSRKNPFTPLVQTQTSSTASQFGSASQGSGTTGGTGSTAASGTSGSGAVAGTGTSGTTTGGTAGTTGGTGSTGSGASTQVFYTYVAEVKFGELGNTQDKTLQRLRSLPTSNNPIVVFLGATVDGDTAVFLVSTSADPSGDGTCKPSKDQCSFLYLKKGDSETFDVADATGALKTYELKLSKISAKKIDSTPSKSAKSSAVRDPRVAKAAARVRKRKVARKVSRYFQAIQRIGF
jgi:hypothetical protein